MDDINMTLQSTRVTSTGPLHLLTVIHLSDIHHLGIQYNQSHLLTPSQHGLCHAYNCIAILNKTKLCTRG